MARRPMEPMGGRHQTVLPRVLIFREPGGSGVRHRAGPSRGRVSCPLPSQGKRLDSAPNAPAYGRRPTSTARDCRSHLKPLRAFFARHPAIDVAAASLERYQRDRLDKAKAPATVNREVHALRRAFNVAARQTPALFSRPLVPYFPSLPVDNVRSGFFERAEVDALLQHVADDGIRNFIA